MSKRLQEFFFPWGSYYPFNRSNLCSSRWWIQQHASVWHGWYFFLKRRRWPRLASACWLIGQLPLWARLMPTSNMMTRYKSLMREVERATAI